MSKKLFVLLIICMVLSNAAVAYASEMTESGLNVLLTTNKEEYSTNDIIKATMTVKNLNQDSVSDVLIEFVLPMGYQTTDNAAVSKQIESLSSGESASFSINIKKIQAAIPKTGDNANPVLWAVLLGLAVVGIIIVCRIMKKGKAMLSLLLCLCIGTSLFCCDYVEAHAEEQSASIDVIHQVKMDGVPIEIKGHVSFIFQNHDDEVTGDFSLRPSEKVKINGTGSVLFYLETGLKTDFITLWYGEDQNLTNSVQMLDNGTGSDDIAGDGIYSASVNLNLNADKKINFVAKHEEKNSNKVTVSYYNPISEAVLDAMDEVNNSMREMLNDESFMSKTEDEKIEQIQAMLDPYAKKGLIEKDSIFADKPNHLVSFVYAENILGGMMYDKFQTGMDGMINQEMLISSQTSKSQQTVSTAQIGNAIILNSFPVFETEQKWIDYRTGFYEKLKNQWDAKGLKTTLIVDPTIENYENLENYDVICVSTHGSRYSWRDGFLWLNYHEVSSICLAEQVTKQKSKSYQAKLKNHEIAEVDDEYWLLPDFWQGSYSNDDFADKFVFIQCCMSLGTGKGANSSQYDYRMSDAIIGLSAVAYVGYHNSVFSDYGREIMEIYVNKLIEGKTSQQAFNAATSSLGSNHEIWYNNNFSQTLQQHCHSEFLANNRNHDYDSLIDVAYPVLRGEPNALLVHGLKNGNLEKKNLFTSKPTSWNLEGDVRSLIQLGAIKPNGTNSLRMAIITTGIGAQHNAQFGNGTEGSMMSQTFLIPSNASKLYFDYNYVSEEPMEYVGSEYDDSFVVQLIYNNQFKFNNTISSINTAEWLPVSDVNFVGGDDTAYQTGWRTVEIDISSLRNKVVTLNFIVYDVGDEIYDSACLIDNVVIQ